MQIQYHSLIRTFNHLCFLALGIVFISCGGGSNAPTIPPAPSSSKDISAYSILGVSGTIGSNTVSLTVPNGTILTALIATFSTSGQTVQVGSTVQISGTTANNFTGDVTYTITAQDLSTKTYTVSVTEAAAPTGQIIADHTVVDKFNTIPQVWIDEVKKMMVYFPGESHSDAYRTGMQLLQSGYPAYTCNVATGEAYTDQYVRVNSGGAGEATWYTWYAYDGHSGANKDVIKNSILEYVTHGHPMHAIGFGWCWDTTWTNDPGGTIDPVYSVHWAGASDGGPDGNLIWGLDEGDIALTGNRVTMNTYLEATEEYRLYAISISAPTKVLFTTGPVDSYTGESGYQGYLKHQHIRNYVASNSARILFDYADILCYNDAGVSNTTSWNGHTYPVIHPDNMGGTSVAHIGSVGAIRLAKAQWWLLARIAGWDGNP